jgi:UDP-N-acetylmuramoylalanine--D-glutamate ligase
MNEFKGKRISVIGAAASGMAVAKLLTRLGAQVFVSESARAERKTGEQAALDELGIPYEFGGHSQRVLEADRIVVSPGVPEIPVLVEACRIGIPIFSEIEIAGTLLPCPSVAVTGTNGKTTTTALIGEICRTAGLSTVVAGNIGTPLSDRVADVPAGGVAVIEVSSFQAEGLHDYRPNVGVLLNLSPDHQDRYPSVSAYYEAKKKLFVRQRSNDVLVYNADDENVCSLIRDLPARRVPFSLRRLLQPGAGVEGDRVVHCRGDEHEEIVRPDEIAIRGRHNLYNALAATAAARALDIDTTSIRDALRTFRGVVHRLEPVRELRGIRFVNDSKATNVDSTFYALDSFRSERVILIAGGRHKGTPYAPLRQPVKEKVKCLVLIGQAAPLMERELGDLTTVIKASSLEEAVRLSLAHAESGDVVLLSPACSSYDMFENYEDRGDRFKTIVNGLS